MNTSAKVSKHLPGEHDQSTHGRKSGEKLFSEQFEKFFGFPLDSVDVDFIESVDNRNDIRKKIVEDIAPSLWDEFKWIVDAAPEDKRSVVFSQFVDDAIFSWEMDSDSEWSLVIHSVLSKKLGIENQYEEPTEEQLDILGGFFSSLIDKIYEKTQSSLSGISHLTLYRGMDKPLDSLRTVSSFTSDRNTAADFGEIVTEVDVPVEFILSTPFTGFGNLNEFEFTVIGGDWFSPREEKVLSKHLPGQHDQSTHGNRIPAFIKAMPAKSDSGLYAHFSNRENVESILRDGLRPSETGVIGAKWEQVMSHALHDGEVALPDWDNGVSIVFEDPDAEHFWRKQGVYDAFFKIFEDTLRERPGLKATPDEVTEYQISTRSEWFSHGAVPPDRILYVFDKDGNVLYDARDSKTDKHLPGEHDQDDHGNRGGQIPIVADDNVPAEARERGTAVVNEASILMSQAGWEMGKVYGDEDSEHPITLGDRIRLVWEPEGDFVARVAGWGRAELNVARMDELSGDIDMEYRTSGWMPSFAATSPAETLVHEWGHTLFATWNRREQEDFYRAFREHQTNFDHVSGYAMEHPTEAVAEIFTFLVLGIEPRERMDRTLFDMAARNFERLKHSPSTGRLDKHLPGQHDQKEHGHRKNPKGVETVTVEYLKREGFEAYVVGGTVRDFLLGRTPKDIDVTTSAEPEEVVALFEEAGYRVIPSGLQHGTVTVLDPDHGPIEITTYRTDGDYSDGRRPDDVKFTKDLREDLSRRDLTINAIAYDSQTGEIVDPFDGQSDIESRTIRAVGNAKTRFLEDGLRPLRAARFASVLGFDVAPSTLSAMKDEDVHKKFRAVSKERIQDEVMKAMKGDNPRKFVELLLDTGLIDNVIPELKPQVGLRQPERYHAHDVIGHSLAALEAATAWTNDPVLRLIALLHDIGKPETYGEKPDGTPQYLGHDARGAEVVKDVMERLKFPRKDIDRAQHLIRHHLFMVTDEMGNAAVRRFIDRVGEENLDDLYAIRRADLIGHGTQAGMETLAEVDRFLKRYERMKERGEHKPQALAVTGRDIIDELGVEEGPEVGRVMRALKEAVTEDPKVNNRDDLLDIARGSLNKAKVYLHPGEGAPPGAEIKNGPRGGRYYETLGSGTDPEYLDVDYELNEAQRETLTPEERSAVSRYCGTPESFRLNDALRHDHVPGDFEDVVPLIDSAIDKSVVPIDVKAYRAMSLREETYQKLVSGIPFEDKAFVSTTVDPQRADSWIEHWVDRNANEERLYGPKKNVILSIDIPKGSKALYATAAGQAKHERELLLPRGSKFVVESVREVQKDVSSIWSTEPVYRTYVYAKARLL